MKRERHERGRAIYNFRCYFCHGYSGDARTLAATYLQSRGITHLAGFALFSAKSKRWKPPSKPTATLSPHNPPSVNIQTTNT